MADVTIENIEMLKSESKFTHAENFTIMDFMMDSIDSCDNYLNWRLLISGGVWRGLKWHQRLRMRIFFWLLAPSKFEIKEK